MKRNRVVLLLSLLICLVFLSIPARADDPTDEILNYEITASVNDDGTVNLVYHIDWKVLRDDIGALEWITVGIPNGEYRSIEPQSDTIRSIGYSSENGSSVRIDFDRSYHAGEIVSFDYAIVQDYMYQMNLFQDGQTAYVFTPGWFDEIEVDNLTVRWAADGATSWSPDCLVKDGYNVWTTSLAPGGTFTVRVNYPNDARGFNEEIRVLEPGEYDGGNYGGGGGGDYNGGDDYGAAFGGFIVLVVMIGLPVWICRKAKNAFDRSAKFGGETKTKITRTKVTYYPVCQGCGAPRGEGETVCSHCGRSYVKSEEVIKEENVPEEDKEALKYKTKGEYRYSSSPDTYVRVNVVNIPVVHHVSSGGGGSSSRGGGCAHSSCACACASCACACACACAGGGRAGCTFKDFYRTDLKLRQLAQRKRR